MAAAYDPLVLAANHQRAIIEQLAKMRADQSCIRQLLVGRRVTSELADGEFIVTSVGMKDAELTIQGKREPPARRSGRWKVIGTSLNHIKLVVSNEAASSREQANG